MRAKHKVSLCECNGSNEDTLASHLKMSDDDDEHNVKESIFGFYHLWIDLGWEWSGKETAKHNRDGQKEKGISVTHSTNHKCRDAARSLGCMFVGFEHKK